MSLVYVLVPSVAGGDWEEMEMYGTWSACEQRMLSVARRRLARGDDPNWCCTILYDGIDKLEPLYSYSILPSGDIVRKNLRR